ncbi:unnamed protein product [Mucor hiemalis]
MSGIPTFAEVKSAWGYIYKYGDNVITLDKILEARGADEAGGYVIGSDPLSDIRIFHSGVASGRHAFIYCRPRIFNDIGSSMAVYIHDQSCNSKDGVWVNDKKMESRSVLELRSNDYIHFMDPRIYPEYKGNPRYTFIKPKTNTIPVRRFDSLYQTLNAIGDGAFGTVHLAVCKSTGKRVAVKEIDMSKCKSKTSSTSLLREISVCMAFPVHPCIIQINRVIEEDNNLYIVMEYGANGDLFTNIAEPVMDLRLQEFEIKIIFDQIAHAILYLHDHNIVHRDLKMENVIMCDRKKLTVKLCDFGLSTFMKKGEKLHTTCGTMMYAAPELLRMKEDGKGYGSAVDIWSLGVLLYTALTNCTPFPQFDDESDESRNKLKHHIMEGLFSFPQPSWKNISEEAQDLIKHMMVLDPTKRYTITDVIAHPWMKTIENEQTKKAGIARNKYLVRFLRKRLVGGLSR